MSSSTQSTIYTMPQRTITRYFSTILPTTSATPPVVDPHKQTKITQFFPSQRPRQPKPKTTFLSLPYKVRRRIYLEADLVSERLIFLNYECGDATPNPLHGDRIEPEEWPLNPTIDAITLRSQSLTHFLDGPLPWPGVQMNRYCSCVDEPDTGWICNCVPFPWQLLYVSKAIADEVFSLFYAENHFAIFRFSHGELSGLQTLPLKALSYMTSLWICLNFDVNNHDWELPYCPQQCYCRLVNGYGYSALIFKATHPFDISALREWKRTCDFLSSNIQAARFKLTLTCDVANVAAAEEILDPLFSRAPLQECAIRLGPYEVAGSALRKLARRAAERLCGKPTNSKFRYLDLPREIQLLILEKTDLVTPCDISWKQYRDESDKGFHFLEHRAADYVDHPNCCEDCSVQSGACSCWTSNAAYSTTCTCWCLPISLFLVSRQMSLDAERIFFQKNHFLIEHTYGGVHSILSFLGRVPVEARQYLRSITWQFCDIEGDEFTRNRYSAGRRKELRDALILIDNHLNTEKLVFAIDYSFGAIVMNDAPLKLEHIQSATEHSKYIGETMTDYGYWKDFKQFFCHVSWSNTEWPETMWIEKHLMGEDYDSIKEEKMKRRHLWNGYVCPLPCACAPRPWRTDYGLVNQQ